MFVGEQKAAFYAVPGVFLIGKIKTHISSNNSLSGG